MNKTINNKGVTAILLVVVIGMVSLIYAKSVSSLGINELVVINTMNEKEKAYDLAESCLSEAMYQIKYYGTQTATEETVVLGEGSCKYNIDFDSGKWNIDSGAWFGDASQNINVEVSSSSLGLRIDEWSTGN